MSHALPAHFGTGYFNAAFVTNNALIAHPLIFTAVALEIFGRAKDSLAK